jgi:hypothetical protein
MSLYLADSGLKNESKDREAKNSINSNPGRIIELSLYQPAAMAASTFESVLSNTIDTSKLTPPSPDPCGVDYLPSSNALLICDSEVEEMTNLWANANLFETTVSGSLNRTAKTTSFTKEPTGIAYNSANGHMFISDDDGHRIFEVAPGTDKLFGTSDDTRTVFYTSYFSSNDPEGVAFDPASNTLFIVDGVNEEVYLVKPGANGLFDGVPAHQLIHVSLSRVLEVLEGVNYPLTNRGCSVPELVPGPVPRRDLLHRLSLIGKESHQIVNILYLEALLDKLSADFVCRLPCPRGYPRTRSGSYPCPASYPLRSRWP